ncbi:hypothetical protein GGX14DRAFT_396011 [Mycena pura]|uniref:Uncharacterized protein n=1 Tax=Mycena pura TaxID=153505 RepID=A0AAD6VC60_9AGAR|nr:hypothetical protein GGX14DRAFT_396011 [Mycena pura]
MQSDGSAMQSDGIRMSYLYTPPTTPPLPLNQSPPTIYPARCGGRIIVDRFLEQRYKRRARREDYRRLICLRCILEQPLSTEDRIIEWTVDLLVCVRRAAGRMRWAAGRMRWAAGLGRHMRGRAIGSRQREAGIGPAEGGEQQAAGRVAGSGWPAARAADRKKRAASSEYCTISTECSLILHFSMSENTNDISKAQGYPLHGCGEKLKIHQNNCRLESRVDQIFDVFGEFLHNQKLVRPKIWWRAVGSGKQRSAGGGYGKWATEAAVKESGQRVLSDAGSVWRTVGNGKQRAAANRGKCLGRRRRQAACEANDILHWQLHEGQTPSGVSKLRTLLRGNSRVQGLGHVILRDDLSQPIKLKLIPSLLLPPQSPVPLSRSAGHETPPVAAPLSPGPMQHPGFLSFSATEPIYLIPMLDALGASPNLRSLSFIYTRGAPDSISATQLTATLRRIAARRSDIALVLELGAVTNRALTTDEQVVARSLACVRHIDVDCASVAAGRAILPWLDLLPALERVTFRSERGIFQAGGRRRDPHSETMRFLEDAMAGLPNVAEVVLRENTAESSAPGGQRVAAHRGLWRTGIYPMTPHSGI